MKEQSVALDEVVISGSNITQKVDRMVVVPTATAMKNSYNPYDLMLNLAIPHLKVDEMCIRDRSGCSSFGTVRRPATVWVCHWRKIRCFLKRYTTIVSGKTLHVCLMATCLKPPIING